LPRRTLSRRFELMLSPLDAACRGGLITLHPKDGKQGSATLTPAPPDSGVRVEALSRICANSANSANRSPGPLFSALYYHEEPARHANAGSAVTVRRLPKGSARVANPPVPGRRAGLVLPLKREKCHQRGRDVHDSYQAQRGPSQREWRVIEKGVAVRVVI
jgi:hypothetical protein